MADAGVPTWAQLLVSSGVLGLVGAGTTRLWKHFVERPQRRAELRAERAELREQEARQKLDMVTGELKATAAAFRSVRRLDELERGSPMSTPPPRDEMPTLEHIIESRADRAWAEQRERERSSPLNPGRADSLDYTLRTYKADMDSTPPGGFDPPDGLKPLGKRFPPPRGARKR